MAEALPFEHSSHGLLTSNRSIGAIRPAGQFEGFKFAEFDAEYGRFRLSKPYELVIFRDSNTLTIRQ